MILTDDSVDVPTVLARVGWALTADGACRGEVCVPLGDAVSLDAVAEKLGMPIVESGHGIRVLGPSSVGGRALTTAEAPDLELPLVLGDDVWRLAAQRGRRTVMVAWAPW